MKTEKLTAYLHHVSRSPIKYLPDGGISTAPRSTESVPVKLAPLRWQERGLSFTASGYGRRIPTEYMVMVNNRWRRVYCCIFSNSGTLYIGKLDENAPSIQIERECE